MSERIQELAEQARDWTEVSYKKQNDQFTSHWDNPIGYTVSQFFEQKFAELIVRECIDKIEDIAESSNNPQPIYRAAVELLEHFGVDE